MRAVSSKISVSSSSSCPLWSRRACWIKSASSSWNRSNASNCYSVICLFVEEAIIRGIMHKEERFRIPIRNIHAVNIFPHLLQLLLASRMQCLNENEMIENTKKPLKFQTIIFARSFRSWSRFAMISRRFSVLLTRDNSDLHAISAVISWCKKARRRS